MLQINIPQSEIYDRAKKMFIDLPEVNLQLEHSLISISKWEAKYNKAFLSDAKKTPEETLDYIRFMTLTQKVPENVYYRLTPENLKQINSYIEAPMTATWFNGQRQIKEGEGQRRKKDVITSELIYYWMFSFNIPMACEKWHLNKLLTLIRVFSVKNNSDKKKSKNETLQDYKAINAQRRAEAAARMKGAKT